MSVTAIIETNADCFETLEKEWLELLERAVTNTIFQTPHFLKTWWKTLGFGTLQIITMRDEAGVLQGTAPLFVQPTETGKQQLCFVGCVNVSDYLDVIISKDHQAEVYEALYQVLTTQLQWDELYWCSLPEKSPTRTFLKDRFKNTVAVEEVIQDVSPQIFLPESYQKYLESLDRKQRHEVKRKWRKLEELEHSFTVVTEETAASEATEKFIKLHKLSSAEKKNFWDESHLAFFRAFVPESAKMGWLKLFFLEIENQKTATMLIFDYNDKYDLYNSGYDPSLYREIGTGANLTTFTIKSAIEEKKVIYDFLRGGEEYKFRLGAVSSNVYDITVTR